MSTVTSKMIDRVLRNTDGRICTISFIKQDGEQRTITGRIGVNYKGEPASHRMDSGKPGDASHKAYFLIYSLKDKGFRRVDVEWVTSIKADGVYIFNGEVLKRMHSSLVSA